METNKFRDIPLGVMLIVIAQFCIYGALYLSNFPSPVEFFGILISVYLMGFFIDLGIRLIRGFEIAESD